MCTIFSDYYKNNSFYDLHEKDQSITPISVIIPCAHVNEIFENNLKSIYREVPVYELLLGDAGLPIETIRIAEKFPRLRIINHHGLTLGYSIRKLIELVKTEHFAYLHSDVYLPNNWYMQMSNYLATYDWYGCRMLQTSMIVHDQPYGERPYAGAQIGRTSKFLRGISKIDDDYMWRQEDFILQQIVEDEGGSVGAIDDIFHYHQLMPKPSSIWNTNIMHVNFKVNMPKEQNNRVMNTQLLGIIKYTKPRSNWLIIELFVCIFYLLDNELIDPLDLYQWTENAGLDWNQYVYSALKQYYMKKIYTK